ncbi:tetratricopeptide repeat protein [Echinicola soli]|uniref:Tetratricopeptide repeat protein n=1 Tax=Echinicola soli TaxID=2591634 RepID=A0A514CKQ5_9BACT|nr:tetratricopeptide repeat protein [Echinicola soli]QDH80378.1 tetratricopeptide repeat protein [Echinicola soli]
MFKKSILGLCICTALFSGCSNKGDSKGDTLFKQGNYKEAIAVYSDKLATKPKDVEALYSRGRAYEELGDLESAKKDFEAGYKQDEKNVKLLLALSNVYQKQGNFDRSLLYAEYATSVAGAPAMAYFLKARALQQIGNTEEAMKEYTAAIEIDDQFGQAYYYRGVLKYATKKQRGACDDFKKASGLGYKAADTALEKYCE